MKTYYSCFLTLILFIQLTVLQGQPVKILINHIGYETGAPKHAVILGYKNDNIASYSIMDVVTGKTMLRGSVTPAGHVTDWRDWYFWTIDFDQLNQEGLYRIVCLVNDTLIQSCAFKVQNNLLERNALSDVVCYFKEDRCSGLMDKADRNLAFSGDKPGTVDVHGGWYDATGDYGKKLSHLDYCSYFNPQQTPLTVWGLFKSYALLKEKNNPDFREFLRRILDEAMYGADYLVRVKDPEGSFYRSVSAPGPEKKPEDRRITPNMTQFSISKKPEDSYPLSENKETPVIQNVYEVSYRTGGGLAIAALALASTYPVCGDFTQKDYLKAAEDGFAYIDKNNLSLTYDGKENITDDYCALLAATELYKATKKDIYKKAADRRADNLLRRLITSGKYNNYWRADDNDRPFFHPSDAGLPVVSLLDYYEIADANMQAGILVTIKKELSSELAITAEVINPFGYSRQLVVDTTGYRRTAFFFPHNTETAPWWQGENARLGSVAAAARLAAPYFKNDPGFYNQLQSYAWNQLNWILGLNPFDACMMEGVGRNNIEYLFFNTYMYKSAPGGICNGITSGLYNENDIDLNRGYKETGLDNDWRWCEQWLPHATWFLIAVSAR